MASQNESKAVKLSKEEQVQAEEAMKKLRERFEKRLQDKVVRMIERKRQKSEFEQKVTKQRGAIKLLQAQRKELSLKIKALRQEIKDLKEEVKAS